MPPAAATYTVAGAARQLGVAPSTLRTWDRRYGIGPSDRSAGTHRRYSATDVERLRLMRRYTLEGVSPSAAAELALAADLDGDGAPSGRVSVDPANAASREASDLRRGLLRAALAMDGDRVLDVTHTTLERRGVVWTWDNLLVPVLGQVGHRWERTGAGVEVEHHFSDRVSTALRNVMAAAGPPMRRPPALLATTPDELHDLPLDALGAALAERHLGSRSLGARVPLEALRDAVVRCCPVAVFVWAHQEETADPDSLVGLLSRAGAPLVVAGGTGWPDLLPRGVRRAHDLTEAVALVARAFRR